MINPIRSFVKRSGRLSKSQQRGLIKLLPKYDALISNKIFTNKNPVYLEIGFGDGDLLIDMASKNPEINFLGIEVHNPGVGHIVNQINKLSLTNIKIAHADAMEFIQTITANSVERIMLFFPDPWHKKKHNKRRIIRPEFITQIIRILAPGGIFHMATDWQEYAEYTVILLNKYKILNNLSPTKKYILKPDYRPLTKFEKRGQQLGHNIWDMMWQKN